MIHLCGREKFKFWGKTSWIKISINTPADANLDFKNITKVRIWTRIPSQNKNCRHLTINKIIDFINISENSVCQKDILAAEWHTEER